MALVSNKSTFLHIAKCSGMWIRHAYKLCNIPHVEVGDQHLHFPTLLRYNDEEFYKSRYTFAFIRHPLTWYQSRWAFRLKNGWRSQHPLDFNCASNDFATFINNVIQYKPDGWVTWEYKSYIDQVPGGIKFIGKTENLVEDTITAFREAGEEFNENVVRLIPRINDSDMDGFTSKQLAKYTPKLVDRVMAVESEIIRRYYHNVDPYSIVDVI
jgi:hypothetical protein